jgi:LIM domain kinase 1
LDNSVSKHEYIYGTDEFMSPEIAMGENFDVSSDIFSFGILLCEIITKKEPSNDFLKRDAKKLFALDENELRESIPYDCPESLEALALQCCDIDPAKRPSSNDCVMWLQVSVHVIVTII